jgi:hypothetical protein
MATLMGALRALRIISSISVLVLSAKRRTLL